MFQILRILIVVGIFYIPTSVFSQSNPLQIQVQANYVNASAKEVISSIAQKYQVNFIYSNDVLEQVDKKITISKNLSLEELLKIIIKDTHLQYKLSGTSILIGQKKRDYTISGYVEDFLTGERLLQANIMDQRSGRGAISNMYGFFSLTLPEDSVAVLFSYIGYHTSVVSYFNNKDSFTLIKLKPSINLGEVVVEAKTKIEEQSQMSEFDLPIEQLKSIPSIGGEADILKNIQLLPGIQSGSEGSTNIYVRGGGPDQNLILLDGIPVYSTAHLFGFVSIFNPDAINNVKIIKGGFPARYGGRLSSVLDIRMKDGNLNKFSGEGSVGLLSSKLSLEGPIVKERTSFFISGRRSYMDLLLKPLIFLFNEANENSKTNFGYHFYDINAKVNHKINDKNRLYLSFYNGRDKGLIEFESQRNDSSMQIYSETSEALKVNWGNTIIGLRWNHIFDNKTFSNTTLTYSGYSFNMINNNYSKFVRPDETEIRDQLIKFTTGIEDYNLRYDIEHVLNHKNYIRAGGYLIHHTFKPGATIVKDTALLKEELMITTNAENIPAVEGALYIENDHDLSTRLRVNYGVHGSFFNVRKKTYASVQPRVSGRYMLGEKWAVKGSFATMSQYIHLLTNSGLNFPTDLWVPPTDEIKPQSSWQTAVGLSGTINIYELSLEGFYKKMYNLIEYEPGASYIIDDENFEEKIVAGTGESYGMEFFARKTSGKTSGFIGYTLSWTNRTFSDIDNGDPFPFRYDTRHDISIALAHQLSKKTTANINWVYRTGNAITLPVINYLAVVDHDSRFGSIPSVITAQEYGERNSFRMPAYHRLDIGLTFTSKKSWEKSLNIGLYNAYMHWNTYYIYYNKSKTNNSSFRKVSFFPIMPFISFNFKF